MIFQRNACELSSIKCQVLLEYLSFGIVQDCFELRVGKEGPMMTPLSEQVCTDDYYYPVVACRAQQGKEQYALPDICPCLSLKDVM